jgi:hypothetical protein
MRLAFVFLCLVSCCFAEPVDVLLVAGQSNAVGADTHPALLPPDAGDALTPFWFRTGDPPPDEADSSSNGAWTVLGPQPLGKPNRKDHKKRQYGNFADAAGGFGPEMGMVRELRAVDGGRRLAVIKVAFSGTSFAQHDWNPGEPCYLALVSEVQKALAAAAVALPGRELRLRAMFWVQGESDAKAGELDLYSKRLRGMMDRLRAELVAPELRVVLAVNTHFQEGKNAFMKELVAQQRAVAAADPERCAYVDTAAATLANAAHFDTAGTLAVGKWMAQGLLALERRR